MIAAVFATFFVGFSGCKQLTSKQDVKPKSATAGKIPTYDEIPAVRTRTIRLANGRQDQVYLPFLEVKTKAQLDSLLKANENWSTEQQTAFEQQYGYSSMLSTFNAGLNVQKMYLSAAAAAGGDALRSKPFADFITNHPHTFRIEGGKDLQLNTFHPSMARVLNANGIIRVAGHIFQYTRQYIKIIEGGDERQIPKLLTATQDDRAAKIRVFPVNQGDATGRYVSRLACKKDIEHNESFGAYKYSDKGEMIGSIIYQLYDYPIYSTPYLFCPSSDDGFALVGPDGVPYCFYVTNIIGYQTNTVFGFDFITRVSVSIEIANEDPPFWFGLPGFPWFENLRAYRNKEVQGSYTLNPGSVSFFSHSNSNEAILAITLYEGPYTPISGNVTFKDTFIPPGVFFEEICGITYSF